MGINPKAKIEDIKSAYKERALRWHPDKHLENKKEYEEKMKELNKAYNILTNPEELKKWEISSNQNEEKSSEEEDITSLSTNTERPSAAYQRFFTVLEKSFQQSPLKKIPDEKRQAIFSGIPTLMKDKKIIGDYYQKLYIAEGNGVEFKDIFQLIAHKTNSFSTNPLLPASFFKETLNPGKATDILLNFLQGKYYGENLVEIQKYLERETIKLYQINNPEVTFYKAITAIITTKNFAEECEKILQAIDRIYTSFYQKRLIGQYSTEDNDLISIMQNKYFRHLLSTALMHFWQAKKNIVNDTLLKDLKSEYSRLKKSLPLGTTALRIEKHINKIFSANPSTKDMHECAHLLIDLSVSSLTAAGNVNSALLAGICYQLAAKAEHASPSRAMAAEYISLSLYQTAINNAFRATPIITLYTTTCAINYLKELTYDQSTLSITELGPFYFNPKDAEVVLHSGSVLQTMQGAMTRALYLIDVFPFYSSPKSTLDFELISIYQLSFLRQLLDDLQTKNPKDQVRSKVLYHAYEDAIRHHYHEENTQSLSMKSIQLKLSTIDTLLEEDKTNTSEMAKMIDFPYIHRGRDENGWLEERNELDFPDKAHIPIYKSFDGYEINHNTGEIKLLYKEWKPTDTRHLRLFSEYDIFQMIKMGIDGGFFSLDHRDSYKIVDPLQIARFAPHYLQDTEFLKTLFMTDYLLKMFTAGAEISASPPYLTRSSEQLIQRLPKHLQKILNICVDKKDYSTPRAHRFWITTNEIERKEVIKNNTATIYFGKVNVTINKHLLKYDAEGNLADAKMDQDDKSPEAEFAREMTSHYDEISEYFPEFRRLKELVKISGAIADLKHIRENNKLAIQELTLKLADNNSWEKEYKEEYKKKYDILTKDHSEFPKFSFQLYDPEIISRYKEFYDQSYRCIYNEQYNALYQEMKKDISQKHGASIWSRDEAIIIKDLQTVTSKGVTDYLNKKLTQQSVLNDYNNQRSALKEEKRQVYYNALLPSKLNIPDSIYNSYINSFIDGNVDPLAKMLANNKVTQDKLSIQTALANRIKLENNFKHMQFDSVNHAEEKEITTLRIPAVFHTNYHSECSNSIYGGVLCYPHYNKVDELSMNLRSPFEFKKDQAIKEAEIFVRNCNSSYQSILSLGASYWGNQQKLWTLEQDIFRAKNELFWIQLEKDKNKYNTNLYQQFSINHEAILKNTAKNIQYALQNLPAWKNDPFAWHRLEENLNRQMSSVTKTRQSITTELDSVMRYTKAIFTGAVEGVGDIAHLLQHPFDFLKPAGQLLLDATIIACAHLPIVIHQAPGIENDESIVTLKEIIRNNPTLYETAKSNMQNRLQNIKEGIDIFLEAKTIDQCQIGTRAAVNLVLPGFILKSTKYALTRTANLSDKPIFQSGFFSQKPADIKPVAKNSASGKTDFSMKAIELSESNYLSESTIPPRIAATFIGNRFKTYKLTDDFIVYRAGAENKPLGQFFSFEKPVSELQVRIDKAIRPVWPDGGTSVVDTGYALKIPKGTIVHVGEVSTQAGIYLGGTTQIYIEAPWNIRNIVVVEKYPLTEELLWNQIAKMRK